MGIFSKIKGLFLSKPEKRRQEIAARYQTRQAARREQWDSEEAELRSVMGMAGGAKYLAGIGGGKMSLADLAAQGQGGPIKARFDSAMTTDDNRNHWAMADGLAADAAASPMVRYVLRNRSRYEVANNCYARGVGETIANHFAGTGPRLHIDDDRFDPEIRHDVEAKFASWCRATNLAEKARTMRKSKRQDGETFALMISNPGLNHPVKLDFRCIEADQVRFIDIALLTVPSIDGIRFDDYGNPVSYNVLRIHPGFWSYATGYIGLPWEFDVWDAKFVIHWFRKDRPGQHRGLPEILPALPLYATLRRYTQAALDAAETAADFAVLLETPAGAPGEDEDEPGVNPLTSVPLARRMMTTLPSGYKPYQMDPKQPTTVYPQFKQEIAGEIGRCENVPPVVVLCDSSDSNFASGKLDYAIYFGDRIIERHDFGIVALDPLFSQWLQEAVLLKNADGSPYVPREMAQGVEHTWYWDSNEMGNPEQLANAKEKMLQIGATTLPQLWAEQGKDFDKAAVQAARAYGLVDITVKGKRVTAVQQYLDLLRFRLTTTKGTPAPIEVFLEEQQYGITPEPVPAANPVKPGED